MDLFERTVVFQRVQYTSTYHQIAELHTIKQQIYHLLMEYRENNLG